jgi:hypothetical protein
MGKLPTFTSSLTSQAYNFYRPVTKSTSVSSSTNDILHGLKDNVRKMSIEMSNYVYQTPSFDANCIEPSACFENVNPLNVQGI